jgi:hypothetical protein
MKDEGAYAVNNPMCTKQSAPSAGCRFSCEASEQPAGIALDLLFSAVLGVTQEADCFGSDRGLRGTIRASSESMGASAERNELGATSAFREYF